MSRTTPRVVSSVLPVMRPEAPANTSAATVMAVTILPISPLIASAAAASRSSSSDILECAVDARLRRRVRPVA